MRQCGTRFSTRSPDEIRAAHGDKNGSLCGLFVDPVAKNVDIGPCADTTKQCVNNLCK